MISMAAHRHVLKTVPKKEYPIDRNANTGRGKGAHSGNNRISTERRKRARAAGLVPPLEYGTLDQALKALE